MDHVEAQIFEQMVARLKLRLGLPWETDNHIGGQAHLGHGLPNTGDQIPVFDHCVSTAHPPQNGVVA